MSGQIPRVRGRARAAWGSWRRRATHDASALPSPGTGENAAGPRAYGRSLAPPASMPSRSPGASRYFCIAASRRPRDCVRYRWRACVTSGAPCGPTRRRSRIGQRWPTIHRPDRAAYVAARLARRARRRSRARPGFLRCEGRGLVGVGIVELDTAGGWCGCKACAYRWQDWQIQPTLQAMASKPTAARRIGATAASFSRTRGGDGVQAQRGRSPRRACDTGAPG